MREILLYSIFKTTFYFKTPEGLMGLAHSLNPTTPPDLAGNILLLCWLGRTNSCFSIPSSASGHLLSLTLSFSSSANLPRFPETSALDEQKAERLAGFLSYPSPQTTKFKAGYLLGWCWGDIASYVRMSPRPQMNPYLRSWKVGSTGVKGPPGAGRGSPKMGFVSKLSPSFLRDTWIMTSINHCRVTTIVNNKNDIY